MSHHSYYIFVDFSTVKPRHSHWSQTIEMNRGRGLATCAIYTFRRKRKGRRGQHHCYPFDTSTWDMLFRIVVSIQARFSFIFFNFSHRRGVCTSVRVCGRCAEYILVQQITLVIKYEKFVWLLRTQLRTVCHLPYVGPHTAQPPPRIPMVRLMMMAIDHMGQFARNHK